VFRSRGAAAVRRSHNLSIMFLLGRMSRGFFVQRAAKVGRGLVGRIWCVCMVCTLCRYPYAGHGTHRDLKRQHSAIYLIFASTNCLSSICIFFLSHYCPIFLIQCPLPSRHPKLSLSLYKSHDSPFNADIPRISATSMQNAAFKAG
jgi:hypothetical protein